MKNVFSPLLYLCSSNFQKKILSSRSQEEEQKRTWYSNPFDLFPSSSSSSALSTTTPSLSVQISTVQLPCKWLYQELFTKLTPQGVFSKGKEKRNTHKRSCISHKYVSLSAIKTHCRSHKLTFIEMKQFILSLISSLRHPVSIVDLGWGKGRGHRAPGGVVRCRRRKWRTASSSLPSGVPLLVVKTGGGCRLLDWVYSREKFYFCKK